MIDDDDDPLGWWGVRLSFVSPAVGSTQNKLSGEPPASFFYATAATRRNILFALSGMILWQVEGGSGAE
jgi:hypothetical protein